jgi:unsaturated rhamnogalacturonyl hydrolase
MIVSSRGVSALLLFAFAAPAADGPAAATRAMTDRVERVWPAGVVQQVGHPGSWGYEVGVLLDGVAAEAAVNPKPGDYEYLKAAVDRFLLPDGTIRMDGPDKPMKAYAADEHQLDHIEPGRAILLQYSRTHEAKYAAAAKFLREQLRAQPRTPSGGFWHKTIYPNQMWLDGAYMAGPFLAEYGKLFDEPADYDEVSKELLLMEAHMRDPQTGLLRHGWDESKQMPWADKTTGLSPEAWGRADGWYVVALVDVLAILPEKHPQRKALIDDLQRTMASVVKYQDAATGLWWEVLDKGGKEGNYLETSASCMFVDALARGVKAGWLPKADEENARRGWSGIQSRFIKQSDNGPVLTGTVSVGGLGGKPYRAGDYAYYLKEKVQDDDPKGVGAYLMAGAAMQALGAKPVVFQKTK